MLPPFQLAELATCHWLELEVTLVAYAAPRRAHPLAVLEALFKGVFEAAGFHTDRVKQLWFWRNQAVDAMTWQAKTEIPITLQLFGLKIEDLRKYNEQLALRFDKSSKNNFGLSNVGAWQVRQLPVLPQQSPNLASTTGLSLDFLTPVLLPHTPGQANTALTAAGFLRLCQTRLRKLFGREAELPPVPALDTSTWRYWRAKHRSQSQAGNPMFLHGCIGRLHLSGEALAAWQPWLALFAHIGLGERLSFSQGRFVVNFQESSHHETSQLAPAQLSLKRPLVLDSAKSGSKLRLDNANLVISHDENTAEQRFPLLRLSGVELHCPCQLSTPLLQACAEENIPIVLATPGHTPLVLVGQQAEMQRYVTLVAHHKAYEALTPALRARLAARLIIAKLTGYRHVIRQRYQAGDHVVLAQLERACSALGITERLAVVRGWEGWATRHYYVWLSRDLSPLGEFRYRQQHGQIQDRINVLLNYSYALLRHRIATTVRLLGLDPYLGVLHEANGRHDALVSDLIELWRPCIDRLALRLVNLKVIQANSFAAEDGYYRLLPVARARLVKEFTCLLLSTPHEGGGSLATVIRQTIASYAKASQELCLESWKPEFGVKLGSSEDGIIFSASDGVSDETT